MAARFFTKTLALLYAKQGYFDEAEIGFRQLLERDPGNADIQKELDAVLKMKTSDGLVNLFSEWVELISKVKSIQ